MIVPRSVRLSAKPKPDVNGSLGKMGIIPEVVGLLIPLEHGSTVLQDQEHVEQLDHLYMRMMVIGNEIFLLAPSTNQPLHCTVGLEGVRWT